MVTALLDAKSLTPATTCHHLPPQIRQLSDLHLFKI